MSDKKEPRVRVIPDRNKRPPEGLKRLPSLSARITDVVDAEREPRDGALLKGLGSRSKITRAKRTQLPASLIPAPRLSLQDQFLARINTPLNAQSGLPTLAQRVAAEGVAAQLGKKAGKQSKRTTKRPRSAVPAVKGKPR